MKLFAYLPSFLISKVLSYLRSNRECALMFRFDPAFRKRVLRESGILAKDGGIPMGFPIHRNQWKAAKKVYHEFKNGKNYVVLTAQPQSGKTGACQGVVYLIHHHLSMGGDRMGLPVDVDNIWFLCGMNDNSLKRQQIREFDGLIPHDQILFSKDLERIRKGRHHLVHQGRLDFHKALIIIDESHYAQSGDEEYLGRLVTGEKTGIVRKKPQASLVHQFIQACVGASLDGDNSKWMPSDLYILSVSATPMSELAHFVRSDLKGQVVLSPGHGYYGFSRMLELGMVKPAHYLGSGREREKLVNVFREEWKSQNSKGIFKYALMRFSNNGEGLAYRLRFIAELEEAGIDIDWIDFHSQERKKSYCAWVQDVNQIVDVIPRKMTVIQVYHTLRAGYQLHTGNVFLVHDSPGAMTDVTAQGLAGRCCGYGKEKDRVLVYCNEKWLRLYADFLGSKFDCMRVPSHSKNIKRGHVDTLERGRKFSARVPCGGILDVNLIDDLISYKKDHGNRYPSFLSKFGDRIVELPFINKKVWESAKFVGVTILDETNKTEGRTTTWAKFWNPAMKSFEKGKCGGFFRSVKLDEKVDDFKYLFINLKPDHPEFGWILMTSQCRLSAVSEDEWIQTTGKEEFHPLNNK